LLPRHIVASPADRLTTATAAAPPRRRAAAPPQYRATLPHSSCGNEPPLLPLMPLCQYRCCCCRCRRCHCRCHRCCCRVAVFPIRRAFNPPCRRNAALPPRRYVSPRHRVVAVPAETVGAELNFRSCCAGRS
jgi:hypothetical protein